jgi:hypothetical protein
MKSMRRPRIKRGRLWTVLAAVVSLSLLIAFPAGAQYMSFTLDFEEGNLRGWTRTGDAFNFQPTFGDNPTARHRGQPSRHHGNYWIGTYEKFQGLQIQNPGDTQGDGPQGTLISPPFTVPSGQLSFLVGGGSSFQTRVELIVSGRRAYFASGRNTETMHRVTWNLTPYARQTAQIRIVDEASGGWGHINADDFRFIGVGQPPAQVSTNLSGAWSCNDGGTYYIRQVGDQVWWYGQSADSGATWTNVFNGRIRGGQIVGRWADVPKGRMMNAGSMTLEIAGNRQLRAVHKTGGFGGSVWTR